jgi:hypothetical protein
MRRVVAVVVVIVVQAYLGSTAHGQSSWQELQMLIRGDRAGTKTTAVQDAKPDTQAGPAPASDRGPDVAVPERGYLGVLADDQNDRGRGVRLLKVAAGSPADKAGLKQDDLVTELGGVRVREMTDMAAILQQVPPGETLIFEVRRGAKKEQIPVTFGRRPIATPETGEKAALPDLNEPGSGTLDQPPADLRRGPLPASDQPASLPPGPRPPAPSVPMTPAESTTPAEPTPPVVPATPADSPLPAIPGVEPPQDPQVQALLKRIEQLEQRVEQLERAVRAKEENKDKEEK